MIELPETEASPYIHNASYIEGLFDSFRIDPSSVPQEWRDYFEGVMGEGVPLSSSTNAQLDVVPIVSHASPVLSSPLSYPSPTTPPAKSSSGAVKDSIRALMMIRNYRVRGHLHADLDPLKLEKRPSHTELDPSFYGFTKDDEDRLIDLDGVLGFQTATIKDILYRLKKTYCGTIGVEFMHIQDPVRKQWIQESFEIIPFALTPYQKKKILLDLIRAELFEKFLHTKFQGAKRFGLDGGESLIPLMECILGNVTADAEQDPKTVQESSQGTSQSTPQEQGKVQHLVIGMAHRGRLNVITHILGKPYRKLFAKFLSTKDDPYAIGSGDVKYHLGYSSERLIQGKKLHLSLMANPSHLEAVNPVVLGKVRAEQHHLQDTQRQKVMSLLIHGDAAFAGQGLVAETLELSDLTGYRTGGTLHIIINNQIGFTTSPPHSRSSPYSSDIAKAIQAPIFHVNSDDPEAVLRVCRIACHYRAKFAQDVVIDLICYRRYGHNEADEPSFTQPLMYKTIAKHPTTATFYAKKLIAEKTLSEGDVKRLYADTQDVLEEEYRMAVEGEDCFNHPHWLKGLWQGIEPGPTDNHIGTSQQTITGVSQEKIREIGGILFKIPKGVAVNNKIIRQLQAKQKMLETGEGFDWATAEALAFATLLDEGHHVRLSGQDCGRGTFSQRHAVLIDQETEEKYIPLNHLKENQPLFDIVDSPLAEASVLGFEYGYSSAHPQNLVLWEAQFGDFANGAQVVIDQFLAAGEMKWSRQNGLVLLLPHGFEGQGPEHSSARLERFLQLCGEGNWCVAYCSTPANYFHILRRQLKQAYRKPLILMTPKSLLRHRLCLSSMADFEGAFKPVIAPPQEAMKQSPSSGDPQAVEKVILCSGKIYYDLIEALAQTGTRHVAIIRVEQFYPWPKQDLIQVLEPYKKAVFMWCQEEPENMGAWHFVDRRLEETLIDLGARECRPRVIARLCAASPATGLLKRHEKEQKAIIEAALAPNQTNSLSTTK